MNGVREIVFNMVNSAPKVEEPNLKDSLDLSEMLSLQMLEVPVGHVKEI